MWLEKLFLKIKFRLVQRHRLILIIILFLILIFFAGVPLLSSELGSAEKRAQWLRSYPVLTKIIPLYWEIRKITDIVYLPYFFKKDQVPTYELIIPSDSRKKMDDSLPKGFSNVIYTNKTWAPAEFKFNGKTYNIEVRYRGQNAVHWNAPKKSYLIKFDKDDLFNGARELSFIIADDRFFVLEELNNYRADKLSLLRPKSGYANLKINGKNNGLYFTIEGWAEEMLAKWEVPDQTNFYELAEQNTDSLVAADYTIWDNLDRWDQLVRDQRFNYGHFTEIFKLLSLLNHATDEEFYQSIFSLIDKDNFYAWQIHQELIHSNHQNNDVKLLFDNTSGKFFFVPWDVGNTNPSSEIELYSRLAKRIFTNPVYWHEKDKILYDYANNKDNLKDDLDFYDKTYNLIKPSLYKDRMKIYTNRWADSLIISRRQALIDAFDKIKDRYKNNLAFIDVGIIDDNAKKFGLNSILAFIDVNTKSYSALWLKAVEAELANGQALSDYKLYYDANSNQELDNNDKLVKDYKDIILYTHRTFDSTTEGGKLELTKYRFYLVSDKISSEDFSDQLNDFKVNLQNGITGDDIKKKEINIKIINQAVFKYFDNISDLSGFERENPFFVVDRQAKRIVLPPGTYQFNKNVIVPKGFTLDINPGVTILMAPSVSIVSYSKVIAQGTAAAPINIFPQIPNQPWGTFGVLNTGNQLNIFENFNVVGGSEAYVNGVYMSGMVSVYHSDISVRNSQFSNAAADDGINVKYGKAALTNNRFMNNSADAIDYDFIKQGQIISSQFINNGNDGVDLSGSTVLIANNHFQNSGDKCVSVGEKSLETVIYNNILDGCKIGVEIKDLSDILIINNVIINNEIGLNAYQKKPVFGGGKAKIYNSIIWDNQNDVQTDPQSVIAIFNSNINRDDLDNNNFNTHPEFVNLSAGDYRVDLPQYKNGGDKGVLEKYLDLKLDQAPVGLIK
ncbi:MAG TPA: CotH kinase family protein [Patescibacteria group bacterium]|nr:CotH kinase family protein [Patescibacteria group bacterium]